MDKYRKWLIWQFVFVFTMSAIPVCAATPDDMAARQVPPHESPDRSVVAKLLRGRQGGQPQVDWERLAGGMAAVLGVLCLGVYALKKLRAASLGGEGRYIEVIESRALGRKVQIYLLRVGDRVLLIACTEDKVSSVAELGSDELPEQPEKSDKGEAGRFSGLVQSLVRGSE